VSRLAVARFKRLHGALASPRIWAAMEPISFTHCRRRLGYVYLTGETLSFQFFQSLPALSRSNTPDSRRTFTGLMALNGVAPDAFVVKLNPAGQIVYATYLGGAGAMGASASPLIRPAAPTSSAARIPRTSP